MSSTFVSDLDTPPEMSRARTADCSDQVLLERVRADDPQAGEQAYAELYRRHEAAAHRLARQLARSSAAADDLVSDSFAAVFAALRNGSGPSEAFRPYLLTTLRRRYWRTSATPESPVDPTDATFDAAVFDPDSDDGRLMAEAYQSLPERWQLVLWHTEVEGSPPAEVAPLVGLSPHATAALASRAREGLREAYLQAHLQAGVPGACDATVTKLGALVRGNLANRDRTKAEAHLAECDRCCELKRELSDVNRALRAIVGPLVLGGAAVAYLGRRSTTTSTSSAIAHSLAGSGRRLTIVGGALALSLGLLVLQTDRSPADPSPTASGPGAAAPTGAAAPPTDDPGAATDPPQAPATTPISLPGGAAVVGVVNQACSAALGVAAATPGTAGGEGVVRAVLFRGDITGLPAATGTSAVTAVQGSAVTTLRGLVGGTDPAATVEAPADGQACVTVPNTALLAGGGTWRLLVAYLPATTEPVTNLVSDLRFAVLDRPFALLGDVTRTAVQVARTTLASVLDELPASTGTVGEPLGLDDLDGATAGLGGTVDDLLGGLAGGGSNTGVGTGGSGGAGGAPPVVPGLPPVTVPPTTVPTAPSIPLPNLPLPGLPLPDLPLPSLPGLPLP